MNSKHPHLEKVFKTLKRKTIRNGLGQNIIKFVYINKYTIQNS